MDMIFYRLSPETKVRKESFGLLFYNTRDTKLTFLDSGDLISVKNLEGGIWEKDLYSDIEVDKKTIKDVLEDLVKRGLILAEKKSS